MRLSFAGVDVRIDGLSIIDGVDLDVPSGRTTVLVGPNGSGKSTLLRTAYRALRPTAGIVLLGEDDAWSIPARDAARRLAGGTQQQVGGGDYNVRELVAMGRGPYHVLLDRDTTRDRELVAEALDRVGMAHLADRPLGTLSGGERQRVLVARALAQQAPAVILDEPTNHLDVGAQLDLLDLIGSLGVTVLAALHDLDQAAAHADRVAVLQRGRLVAVGAPLEVLTPGLIADVFGVDAHVGPHPITGRPHIAVALRRATTTKEI